ncbi:BREX-1 system adenine-specific DNA-methyltransferase PglX [Oceanobacillus manasiensis]|uniref:BREX-1 system adenine-specific DNA-methyltransferase PglX n=1 Tax=Oceanobacillus manasiensis TaxID=586413 RepID=UPI0005AA2725|nr:BREX-1 system adenine-specific DNA-methyltransferase PglX [Oceanobacillus manasiensis]
MNKGAIKKFAVTARVKLMEAVEQKAFELGITKEAIKDAEVYQDGFMINQKFYKKYEIKQREKLVQEIQQKGYDQVIEEVAYTWFNRFIALRFMEANDYLPTGVRIFSSIEEGKKDPDALTEVLMLVDELGLDEQKVYELQDTNETEDLFKYILIKQCNKLGEIMPMMFEEIQDYTELLIPDNLLVETSVVHDMVTMIDENDWQTEVEIIGWLYQYYISEKKDAVFADLKKNKKIAKENIPAATELFTPRWIVQYMVDNSLGRFWLESHSDTNLQGKLPYYLESAEQPESVVNHLETLKDSNLTPESITFFDPCMGSGHILVYAFDVLYQMYKSQGYREQNIPKLIMENNLYGLDIDPRAAQLAYFALMMKARSYNYRLFDQELKTNIRWMEESNQLTEQDIEICVRDTDLKNDMTLLLDTFHDAKLYGSIIEVPELDISSLRERAKSLKEKESNDMFEIDFKDNSLTVIERIIDQAEILSKAYDVVVTNPPYMGRKGMNAELSKYVKKNYKDSSADLYAVFMEVASRSVRENGFIGMINQHSWMFLSSFEKLRESMLRAHQIYSMAHLGTRAFADIGGEVVQTTSFIMRKRVIPEYVATFVRLTDYNNAEEKARQFFNNESQYKRIQDGFADVPGSPIAYWASDQVRKAFSQNPNLSNFADVKKGSFTGNNDIYLKLWHEITYQKIGFNFSNREESKKSLYKWFPYNKGGSFRKWYGNNEYVINWENDGEELRNFKKFGMRNPKYFFKEGITWSSLTSGDVSFRWSPQGFLFDSKGPMIFPKESNLIANILSLVNSKISNRLLSLLAPTLDFNPTPVSNVPIAKNLFNQLTEETNLLSESNINLSKSDWDSFETSWDFKIHPFIEFKQDSTKLSEVYSNWEQETEHRFQTLKANEEELNRIFIDLYGLQDELTPEVEDKEVTIRRADKGRDVKSFLSYTVGLMLGRYSLDTEGLAFAGGAFDIDNYQSSKPDPDNVIPITDDTYFEDDIVSRFITIMKTIFSEETLEENLDFIADTLTRKGNETSRQCIRRYFLKEFYKDHVKTYQKRPIYWLFDSGKQDGFRALVYLHRYEPGLVSRVRTDYLHAQQRKYMEEIERKDMLLESDITQQEKTKEKKKKEKLQKQVLECQNYDQVIAHVANQKLDLDLDDGVKVNYAKFQDIEVPQGEGRKALKANVLAKL